MKRAFKDISEIIHQTDPKASFAIEFWDGDSINIGDKPKFVLRFKSIRSAKRIFRDGYVGFGESYMNGDVEIENDLQELLRLGFLINFDDFRLFYWQKIRFFILELLNSDTLRTAPNNISYHENLRLHYAKTLDQWAENYENNIEKVKKMFDDTFSRQWHLFLHGASAGFKYGMSRLYQVLFTKGLNNTLPTTRSHVYNKL